MIGTLSAGEGRTNPLRRWLSSESFFGSVHPTGELELLPLVGARFDGVAIDADRRRTEEAHPVGVFGPFHFDDAPHKSHPGLGAHTLPEIARPDVAATTIQ